MQTVLYGESSQYSVHVYIVYYVYFSNCTYTTTPGTCFTKGLWAHCSNLVRNRVVLTPITVVKSSRFYTCHVTAKLWPIWCIRIHIIYKIIFSKIQLFAHKPNVIWLKGPRCSISISNSIVFLSLCGLTTTRWPTSFFTNIPVVRHQNTSLTQDILARQTFQLIDCFCNGLMILTHWGRVTHICVSKLTIIGSDNGLAPGWHQAIIWTSAGILLIGPMEQTSAKS